MKNIILLIVIAFSFVHCSETPPKTVTPPALTTPVKTVAVQAETIEMTIEGMMCAIGCAATIEKKLAKSEGIEEVKVDFDTKKALIRYDKEFLNPVKITKIIQGVGKSYTVSEYSVLN